MAHPAPSHAERIRLMATGSHREARNSLISGALELNLIPFGQEPSFTCKTHFVVGTPGVAAHRITSVAWKRNVGGIVRPRASAVLRLMTSSNVVGCSTGRSAGWAPLRILST
jgi:hypothetical protein